MYANRKSSKVEQVTEATSDVVITREELLEAGHDEGHDADVSAEALPEKDCEPDPITPDASPTKL